MQGNSHVQQLEQFDLSADHLSKIQRTLKESRRTIDDVRS